MLDITTTATIRPDIFYRCLESFTEKLFVHKKEYRLILNVDPIGDDVDPMEMVRVGKQFFDNIVYNIPEEPNFAQACKWCWGETSSEFIFHLEDDWVLKRAINVGELISLFRHENLMGVRLTKNEINTLTQEEKKNKFIKNRKLVLNPIFYRGDFIRDISMKMDIENNPEKQLRRKYKLPKDKFVGIYCGLGLGHYGSGRVVRHLGRKWQKQSNYKKRKGSNFITWEKK
jgi:hypothetical protein